MKKTVFFCLLVIVLVFGFLGCDNGNGNEEKIYSVIIGSLINGSIIANPTSGIAGTEISLIVNPDDLYRLKIGSLKYGSTAINETTLKFNLPESNVTVNAIFESFFIGSWLCNELIYTYFEDFYTVKYLDGKYLLKGIWNIENPNKFVMIHTHAGSVDSVDDLSKLDTEEVFNFTFEILSDSSFKLDDWVLKSNN